MYRDSAKFGSILRSTTNVLSSSDGFGTNRGKSLSTRTIRWRFCSQSQKGPDSDLGSATARVHGILQPTNSSGWMPSARRLRALARGLPLQLKHLLKSDKINPWAELRKDQPGPAERACFGECLQPFELGNLPPNFLKVGTKVTGALERAKDEGPRTGRLRQFEFCFRRNA